MRLTPASVRGKAVLSAAIAMTAFGLVVGAASYALVSQVARSSSDEILAASVDNVRDQIVVEEIGYADVEVGSAADAVLTQVVAEDGTVLAGTPGIPPGVTLCPAVFPAVRTVDNFQSPDGGTTYFREVEPIVHEGERVAVCSVISDEQVRRAQSAVLLALLVILPFVIGGVCLAVWLSVGRALRAVDDLTSQAEELQKGSDRALRVQHTGDEVERLGRTLNDLLEHLAQQTRSTRQFVADAGHELRNPLTTLRVALEFGETESPEQLRSSMAEALADLDRLEQLVQDLLALARTDAMDSARHFDLVDLDVLVGQATDSLRRARPDVEVVETLAPCQVQGDVGALRGLVANLLDNAARHAVGRIEVRLTADDRTATLHIDDDGRGLRAEDCERVFRRFVRLDEARDRDDGGSGLGLAIVASAAAAHGGTAVARPGPGGHFEVTIGRSPRLT